MALFGFGRRGSDTVAGPPREWVRDLRTVVSSLADAADVVDHVLTGQHASVLLALQKTADARTGVWLPRGKGMPGTVARSPLRSLYAGFGGVDAEVLRRWAHVLDALESRWNGWGTTTAPVAGASWHDRMIAQMIAATPGSGPLPASFDDLARIAALDGVGPVALVSSLVRESPHSRSSVGYLRTQLRRLPGFGEALVAHADEVATALTDGAVGDRLVALEVVGAVLTDEQLGAVVGPLVDAATSTSAQVREGAGPVLARASGAGPALRVAAVRGNPQVRARALELLAARPEERDWARGTAQADRAASVQGLVVRWDAAEAALAEDGPDESRPVPLPPTRWAVPRPAAEECARRLVDGLAESITASNRRAARLQPPGHPPVHPWPVPTERTYRDLVSVLVSDAPPPLRWVVFRSAEWMVGQVLLRMADDGPLDAAAAVALLAALGELGGTGPSIGEQVLRAVYRRTGTPDLRTLQKMLDETGLDGRTLIWSSYSRGYGLRLGRGWDDADVWPFVAEHLDWIFTATNVSGWGVDELALLSAAATLPTQPARLVDHLVTVALGSRKTLRRPAQDALAKIPGIVARAAAGLQDGKGDTRLAAAQWVGRLGDAAALPALPALRAAWAKERQDVVRGGLLDALVALGERAETYLDPEATSRNAARAVAKGLPAALGWCDWDALPEVTWAASGEPVPREVLPWLCATAVKARSPEPGAVLRHYAALLAPTDRERLAHHLLTAWMRADLQPNAADVAEDAARQQATYGHGWMTSSPDSPYHGMTVEELTAALLPRYLQQPAGSAIAAKGVLAVVAACGGRDVVAPTERYLREWFGQRAAQGKALITMLAWVEDPSAVQLVLAIGSRFRTRSFQEEAMTQAHALAERKGWTVDELADRTIPTGGFDDAGVLELSFGPRAFVARLRPDLSVELRDPDGKVVKALPSPRQSDDAELATEAKRALAAGRKDVKTVATLQQQRLYEALCTERSWSGEDWQRYLCGHPVVGPAVRRLVWVATVEGAKPGAGEQVAPGPVVFRPLDDGTLTDVDDEPVTLPPGARVRLAHDSVLTPEQVEAWTAHLADSEVAPLFQQLGRGVRSVSPEDRGRRSVDDCEGHLVGSFALRNRATALGYTRGATGDGGWFTSYVKRFPTLGIVAEIEFTGSPLPEEDRTVALLALAFSRESPGLPGAAPLTLGEVPAVLVSECWHDLHRLSAQGTGFDAEWQQKSSY